MPDWIDELKGDIKIESGDKPVVATLATVRLISTGPQADARSVVVRQVSDAGELQIVSDARSQKNHQLKQNAAAAVVFWFPKLRKQFRVSGTAQVLSDAHADPMRMQAWRDLSDSSRALFHWPASGEQRRDGDEFVKAISADSSAPASFELLVVSAGVVETLDLNPHPHLRVVWAVSDGLWRSSTVNP